MRERKPKAQRREKRLVFRVTQEEYERFSSEARKRHMDKAEFLRYLMVRYFEENPK